MPERTIWIAAGLLGLIVAVALAVLTSYVARPPDGLTSEPVSAGRQLTPTRDTPTATSTAGARRPAARATTTQASAPSAAAEAPDAGDDAAVSGEPSSSRDAGSGSGSDSDDSSGRGRGRGRGGDGIRGGDD
jgi:hypothetical protein